MRLPSSPSATILLLLWSLVVPLRAVTLQEIESTPDLTPERFARFFRSFEFQFHDEVQPPDVFLRSGSGDCDDFAILAADVLKRRGYTPRLVAIRMPKVVHVVCYIQETRSFLDYNVRTQGTPVPSPSSLGEIARRVARFYGTKWTSVSEFTYERGGKRLVQTILPETNRQIASVAR